MVISCRTLKNISIEHFFNTSLYVLMLDSPAEDWSFKETPIVFKCGLCAREIVIRVRSIKLVFHH